MAPTVSFAVCVQSAAGVRFIRPCTVAPDLAFVVTEILYLAVVVAGNNKTTNEAGESREGGEKKHAGLHFGGFDSCGFWVLVCGVENVWLMVLEIDKRRRREQSCQGTLPCEVCLVVVW